MPVKNVMLKNLGLPEYDAAVLTVTKEMADFFEATVEEVQMLSCFQLADG